MSAGRKINSQSQEWCTPSKYAVAVSEFFGWNLDLDPCSNKNSIVPSKIKYCLPNFNGLLESWNFPTIFVNPPYGRDKERGTSILNWLARCAVSNQIHNSEVLALIPVATNTKHWKHYVFGQAKAICFLADTRLKFLINGEEKGTGAPMACAMVYWGKDVKRFREYFAKFGFVVDLISASCPQEYCQGN